MAILASHLLRIIAARATLRAQSASQAPWPLSAVRTDPADLIWRARKPDAFASADQAERWGSDLIRECHAGHPRDRATTRARTTEHTRNDSTEAPSNQAQA